jgi:hypothetical protein
MKNKLWILLVIGAVLITACGAKPVEEAQAVEVEEETTGITVKDVVFTRTLGENMDPVDPTDTFLPSETINVSVVIDGRPKSGIVTGNFYYGSQFIAGTDIDIAEANSGVLFSVGEDTYVGFTLSHDDPFPVSDDFFVEVLIDGEKLGDFPFSVAE